MDFFLWKATMRWPGFFVNHIYFKYFWIVSVYHIFNMNVINITHITVIVLF